MFRRCSARRGSRQAIAGKPVMQCRDEANRLCRVTYRRQVYFVTANYDIPCKDGPGWPVGAQWRQIMFAVERVDRVPVSMVLLPLNNYQSPAPILEGMLLGSLYSIPTSMFRKG